MSEWRKEEKERYKNIQGYKTKAEKIQREEQKVVKVKVKVKLWRWRIDRKRANKLTDRPEVKEVGWGKSEETETVGEQKETEIEMRKGKTNTKIEKLIRRRLKYRVR